METSRIQCQICYNEPSSKSSFLCSACVRNLLYQPRLRNAQVLLSKEALCRDVDQVLSHNAKQQHSVTTALEAERVAIAGAKYKQDRSLEQDCYERQKWAQNKIMMLKEDISEIQADCARRRAELSKRKQELEVSQRELAQCDSIEVDSIENRIAQTDADWASVRTRTADVRVFLCKELASLYGLIQRKRRKGPLTRDHYLLGQVPVVDLRDLNGTNPDHITVSAGRVAHVVYLASHYLSIRLPAEIILPSPSNPYASIVPPISSYKDKSIPGLSKNGGSAPSHIRPRILAIDRPLPALASDDPLAYSLFIEAMSILAWDIAWLGRTQGISIGITHWEEICAIGPNLQLLFGPASRPSSERQSLTGGGVLKTTTSSSNRRLNSNQRTNDVSDTNTSGIYQDLALPSPGNLSHLSSRAFISASAGVGGGAELMRSWQYASPYKLIDKIKSALASERMGAEWEVLDKDDYEWTDQAGGINKTASVTRS